VNDKRKRHLPRPANGHSRPAPGLDARLRADAGEFAASPSGRPSAAAVECLRRELDGLPSRAAPRRRGPWVELAAALLVAALLPLAFPIGGGGERTGVGTEGADTGSSADSTPAGSNPVGPALALEPTRLLQQEFVAMTDDARRVADALRSRLPRPVDQLVFSVRSTSGR